MERYVLRTHLLENPEVVFYYKGISKVNPDAPMALRCVVGFTADMPTCSIVSTKLRSFATYSTKTEQPCERAAMLSLK